MKAFRKMAVCLIVLLCATTAFAVNAQKIYPVDSTLYQTIKEVYVITGHALPSTTGPWSAQELLNMCDEISLSEVPSFLKEDYSAVIDELKEQPEHQWKGIGATFSNELNLEFYAHTNNDSEYSRSDVSGVQEQLFIGRDNWAYDLKQITPLYRLNWETWVADMAYSYFEFGLFNSYHAKDELGTSKLSTNIFLFQNLSVDAGLMDANFPYRAFVAIGGNHWSAQIGRDRLSWGAGATGNLSMSDDFIYQNIGRFTAFSDKYKYTFLTSFFPNKKMYYNAYNSDTQADGTYYSAMNNGYGDTELDGVLMYMAHRVEGRFLNDKLNVALTEAIMYNSENNHLDLALINPVTIYHNNYIAASSNSTLTFEADYTPINGLNVYAQALVDEFAIPFIEAQPGPNKDNKEGPNRYGLLFGATYEMGLLDGFFKVNAEFASIDPYTYLREWRKSDDIYGLDYVGSVRMWSTSYAHHVYEFNNEEYETSGITYDESIIGYPYGPDCQVLNLTAAWRKQKLGLNFKLFQMWHGTNDMWTKSYDVPAHCSEEDFDSYFVTPTTQAGKEGSFRYSDTDKRNAVMTLTQVGVGATYQLTDAINVYGQADLVFVGNAYNIEGQNDSDFQFVIGASYKF